MRVVSVATPTRMSSDVPAKPRKVVRPVTPSTAVGASARKPRKTLPRMERRSRTLVM